MTIVYFYSFETSVKSKLCYCNLYNAVFNKAIFCIKIQVSFWLGRDSGDFDSDTHTVRVGATARPWGLSRSTLVNKPVPVLQPIYNVLWCHLFLLLRYYMVEIQTRFKNLIWKSDCLSTAKWVSTIIVPRITRQCEASHILMQFLERRPSLPRAIPEKEQWVFTSDSRTEKRVSSTTSDSRTESLQRLIPQRRKFPRRASLASTYYFAKSREQPTKSA